MTSNVQKVGAQPVDSSPVSELARLPDHLAIIKMENDSILAAAAARPRDYKQILVDLRTQLDAYPAFARSALYSKPVGQDEHGRQKVATGPSIRMAEAIAEAYGYNSVETAMRVIDDDHVEVAARFIDYQRGRRWVTTSIVSKLYTKAKHKGGGVGRIDDERFYNVVCKAATSKCVREVILRCVPPGLREELQNTVENAIDEQLTPQAIAKIVAAFESFRIYQKDIERFMGKPIIDINKDERRQVQGLYTALCDQEITADEFRAWLEDDTATPGTGDRRAEMFKNIKERGSAAPVQPKTEAKQEAPAPSPAKVPDPPNMDAIGPATAPAGPPPSTDRKYTDEDMEDVTRDVIQWATNLSPRERRKIVTDLGYAAQSTVSVGSWPWDVVLDVYQRAVVAGQKS